MVISRRVSRQTCRPFETKYHYLLAGLHRAVSSVRAIIGNIGQFRVATTCTSAFCHTSLQIWPCCRHVHLFVLHIFLQLQYMMSSSSAGAAGLSVCIGRHFPSTMCHPTFFWLHTVTFSFPVHYMIVHLKAVVQCSR